MLQLTYVGLIHTVLSSRNVLCYHLKVYSPFPLNFAIFPICFKNFSGALIVATKKAYLHLYNSSANSTDGLVSSEI